MILPNKKIKLSYSLLGTGSIIITNLTSSHTVSSLWEKVKGFSEINNYEKFILTLDLLFSLDLIKLSRGRIIINKK